MDDKQLLLLAVPQWKKRELFTTFQGSTFMNSFICQESPAAIKLLSFTFYKCINNIAENEFLWQNRTGQIWNS